LPSTKLNPRSGGVLVQCAWKQVEVELEREWCTLAAGCTYFALHIWFNQDQHWLLLLGHWPTLRRQAAPLAVAVEDPREPVPFRFACGHADVGTASSALDGALDPSAL